MQDQNAAFSAYESGDANVKDIPTQEIDSLKQTDYHIDPNLEHTILI